LVFDSSSASPLQLEAGNGTPADDGIAAFHSIPHAVWCVRAAPRLPPSSRLTSARLEPPALDARAAPRARRDDCPPFRRSRRRSAITRYRGHGAMAASSMSGPSPFGGGRDVRVAPKRKQRLGVSRDDDDDAAAA
jgi:hypothetical protein